MAGLSTVVASLNRKVVTSSSRPTVLRNMAGLSTSVTLGVVGLTVSGKMVRTSTLVTGGRRLELRSSRSRRWLFSSRSIAVLRYVAKLTTIVTLGTLFLSWTVRLNMSHITTQVTLFMGGQFWFLTF
ncbi:hypothetical protein CANTEDRAFT_107765 [Yamadazyma tenuis ATCC 10573]|uniref:Uncharacterized protein n=1 Tax=Candida tenuis (strain ATCC 10573 / BCRC 21748 / CBS 615 / JCM 9827 / NBRC 10315 / NRRL Y-1498 / VKM Y-70) TaxID=590646 RepID=G3BAK0_CANTC|nr:uncharacterized protein CANTEDRAFT_107765 [Yamadazyma tenuis ATCC 10573]EGV61423.1 hypothetical protein CANTEDRAFT_107765 [Yamadazyma tenuis ATCC 10573]